MNDYEYFTAVYLTLLSFIGGVLVGNVITTLFSSTWLNWYMYLAGLVLWLLAMLGFSQLRKMKAEGGNNEKE